MTNIIRRTLNKQKIQMCRYCHEAATGTPNFPTKTQKKNYDNTELTLALQGRFLSKKGTYRDTAAADCEMCGGTFDGTYTHTHTTL